MRLSLFRLRYYLGLRDAINVFWHGYTTNFRRLKLNAYKHPVYLRGPQDYDGFDFILVAKDYKFRLPHVPQTILLKSQEIDESTGSAPTKELD